jgi:hypothetical protein
MEARSPNLPILAPGCSFLTCQYLHFPINCNNLQRVALTSRQNQPRPSAKPKIPDESRSFERELWLPIEGAQSALLPALRSDRPYQQSSRRIVHRVHRLWDFQDPACGLLGQPCWGGVPKGPESKSSGPDPRAFLRYGPQRLSGGRGRFQSIVPGFFRLGAVGAYRKRQPIPEFAVGRLQGQCSRVVCLN